jgi:hypothetical protein
LSTSPRYAYAIIEVKFMRSQLHIAVRIVLFISVVATAFGCGGDDDDPSGGSGTGGHAGDHAGEAGSKAGNSASGSGGSAAGTGGGAAKDDDLTCASAKKGTPAELHDAAAAALLPTATNKGCAFSSCHDMSSMKAKLTLLDTPKDLRMQLVGKMSCEVPSLPLVDTSGGEAALAKSWLWQKLVAPAGSDGQLMPKSEWGVPVTTCGQEKEFGLRMPRSQTADPWTPTSKLQAVRDWICAGAPGPS